MVLHRPNDTGIERVNVLDHGYVRMEHSMGNDLTPVNAARVSHDKRSEEFKPRDQKLVNFLGENDHTSPFRHAAMTFEVYAPMFVKNQWWKYVVGHMHDPMQAWNESSRRYVTEEPVFYNPEWRWAPDSKRQGSGQAIHPEETLSNGNPAKYLIHRLNADMNGAIADGLKKYNNAIEWGVAPEQARVFLPAYAMYVRWWWTCSLQGALHLIEQRTAPDAQWEFQQFARVVEDMVRQKFPVATAALLGR